jgi:hypothetical protein
MKNWKLGKFYSNKVARKYKFLSGKGKSYKKLFSSWDICDYKSFPVGEKEREMITKYKYRIK